MKYLKYFNNHTTREQYQTTNEDRTLVHYCDDANHLHYLNCSQKIEDTPIEETSDITVIHFNIISLIDGIDEVIRFSDDLDVPPEMVEESIVENNLNFIKKYYKVKDDSLVFDEEVFLEDFTVSETYYFPSYPMSDESTMVSPISITPYIIPSINGTFKEDYTGYAIIQSFTYKGEYEEYQPDDISIGSSNKSIDENISSGSLLINNNLAIRIYLNGDSSGGGESIVKLQTKEASLKSSFQSMMIYLLPIKNYIITTNQETNDKYIIQLYISIPYIIDNSYYSRDNILCFGIKRYNYNSTYIIESPSEKNNGKRKISDDEDINYFYSEFTLIFPIQQFRTDLLYKDSNSSPITPPYSWE